MQAVVDYVKANWVAIVSAVGFGFVLGLLVSL